MLLINPKLIWRLLDLQFLASENLHRTVDRNLLTFQVSLLSLQVNGGGCGLATEWRLITTPWKHPLSRDIITRQIYLGQPQNGEGPKSKRWYANFVNWSIFSRTKKHKLSGFGENIILGYLLVHSLQVQQEKLFSHVYQSPLNVGRLVILLSSFSPSSLSAWWVTDVIQLVEHWKRYQKPRNHNVLRQGRTWDHFAPWVSLVFCNPAPGGEHWSSALRWDWHGHGCKLSFLKV